MPARDQSKSASFVQKAYRRARSALGRFVINSGNIRAASRIFNVHPKSVAYWQEKTKNPSFHPLSHGGLRRMAFTPSEYEEINNILWNLCQRKPTARLGEYHRELSEHNFEVSLMFISRVFKQWQWSFKKPSFEQLNKYTQENILYYATYQHCIKEIPWMHLKFADESHFNSKDLQRDKVLSPKNSSAQTPNTAPIDETYSMTLLTSVNPLEPAPIVITLREASNSAVDFLDTVQFWLDSEHLREGDILIVDNAAIHIADEIFQQLTTLLANKQVRMKTLPTYSPELNPCELVFGLIKNHMRHWRSNNRFIAEIIKAAACVSYRHVLSYYGKCVNR